MNLTEIREKIFKDSYIDIALREYLKFRVSKDNGETNDYGENYKEIILKDINDKIHDMRITAENVIEVIKLLQKQNPSSGSFVHWSNLDDLKGYADKRPQEAATLFNTLYDDTLSVEERIELFYTKGKEFDPKINLGTPLFGYLLAGFDRAKYPLYKDQIFKDFLETFSAKESIGNIAAKYSFYCDVCRIILNEIKEKRYIENPTMIDVQDFIFCITQYPELYVKVAVIYLNEHAKKLKACKDDTNIFLDYINNLEDDYLRNIMQLYSKGEKVNKIRYILAEKIINNEKITMELYENIKNEVKRTFEGDILKSWGDFGIIFPLYFEQYKKKVDGELRKIYKSIVGLEKFKTTNFKKDKYICNFWGPANFGSTTCWLAAYPEDKNDHKDAWQLFFGVEPDKIRYGLYPGSNLGVSDTEKYIDEINRSEEFSYNEMKQKYIKVYDKFGNLNNSEDATRVVPEIIGDEKLPIELIVSGKVKIPEVSFDKEVIIDNLYFEDMERIKSQVETSIRNGKNIILIGPPGTGKSKLAIDICTSYGVEYNMTTASSDWSTYETIGGYKPDKEGKLFFSPGIFLNCLKDRKNNYPLNRWIIIDELNRADIDKAFGSLFSALTGDRVMLSYQSDSGENIVLKPQGKDEKEITPLDYEYIIPEDFRIIGTMNTYDKASLYEMSYAFMRRFAFIPVPVPRIINDALVERYLDIWNVEDKSFNGIELASGLSGIWKIINKYRIVGPAIIEDIARYVSEAGDYTSAIILYVLPQFEGLSEDMIKQFVNDLCEGELKPLIIKDMLMDFVEDFFGINLRNS